ncbi:MAG: Co2+/Mg2+ efflux protein ApaG [Methyloligellaceae bacterium]|nr:MAG: Co2+/Mg2+ efflux protein ApaG [Alphaproteobacteria bacterium]
MLYETTTNFIRVRVEPAFEEEESSPADSHFFWSYTVEIENLSQEPVQLRSRFWQITDASGFVEEIRGLGVVGEQPVIAPGDVFRYTSGAPLGTSSGIMVGCYQMETPSGKLFNVDVPAFSLDSPYIRHRLN